MRNIDYVKRFDPEIGNAMNMELERQQGNIELIASENIVSEAVMAAMGTVLTNKYAEGYPGKRYYGGCEKVDIVEDIATDSLTYDHNSEIYYAITKQNKQIDKIKEYYKSDNPKMYNFLTRYKNENSVLPNGKYTA